MVSEPTKRHPVAILGGGMGGLAAAWELTRSHPGAFEITVYQRDSRLGGKGASSRHSDERYGHRIEEHGIHILMGWYDAAIGLLEEVYADLEANPPSPEFGRLRRFPDDVLLPHDGATMAESPALTGDPSKWDFWTVHFPRRPGRRGEVPSVSMLVVRSLRWLGRFRTELAELVGSSAAPSLYRLAADEHRVSAEEFAEGDEAITEEEAQAFLDSLELEKASDALGQDAQHLAELYRSRESAAKDVDWARKARRAFVAFWFLQANVRGLLAERVRTREDFDRFDHLDYADWLRRHGGRAFDGDEPYTVDSPIVQILYDLAFGRGKKFAAGVWAYAFVLFGFGYRGSYVYKMNGGMGDIVFAPLYLALRRRGVRFRFGHEVKDVVVEAGRVVAITMEDTAGLPDGFVPLVPVPIPEGDHGPTPCWPEPVDPSGAPRRYDLVLGEHFESVVLGISVGGLADSCGGLLRASPRFRAMVEASGTVATQCAQIWLDQPRTALGWKPDDLVASFVRPLNSCVDMSHVLGSEPWPAEDAPKSCIYFCDQVGDRATAKDVAAALETFLGRTGRPLLPEFDWSNLVDPEGRRGVDRLKAQYVRANTVGSDRYVITPPGSPAFRLAPGDSTFSNVVLAGDWTKTRINAGCLEAATLSGLEAGAELAKRVLPVRTATTSLGASDARPRYVDSPVDWVRPHPLAFEKATMDLALVRASDPDALRATCKRLIEEPTGGAIRVEPIGDRILVTFASIARGISVVEPETGYLTENECVFFVPVRWWRPGELRMRVAMLAPVAYVDQPIAVVAGREIYGFPKFPGTVDIDPTRSRFEVRSMALSTFGPDARAIDARLCRLELRDGARTEESLAASSEEATVRAALRALGDDAVGDAFISEASDRAAIELGGLPLLFLKQVRDVEDPQRAAMQEVVRATARIRRIRGGRVRRGDVRLEVEALARPDLLATLGVARESTAGTLVSVDVDFEFGAGHVLHRS